MSTYVHNDTTYKTQILETTQMPINNRMDKMWYIHAIDEHFTTLHATIWSQKQCWKPNIKEHILYTYYDFFMLCKNNQWCWSQQSSYPAGEEQGGVWDIGVVT